MKTSFNLGLGRNQLLLCLLNCFSMRYFLASEMNGVNAQSEQGEVNLPTCAMPLIVPKFINETLLLVWAYLGDQCGNAPAVGFYESATRCNATLFGNSTIRINSPNSSTGICSSNNELSIYTSNQTVSTTMAFNTLVSCLRNLTYIQEQCAERHDTRNTYLILLGVGVGVMYYLMCVCKGVNGKFPMPDSRGGNYSSPPKTESSHLLDDIELQSPKK